MNYKNKNAEEFIKEEYKKVKEEPIPSLGISVGLYEDNNYFKWKIIIFAPDDSIYAGGVFEMSIRFNENFPESKHYITFTTKIYHCNVSDDGDVDIPSLKKWNRNITMNEVLSDIFSLFYEQNPQNNFNRELSNEYIYNRNIFEEKVKKRILGY